MRAMNENSSDSSLDRQTTNANQRSDERDVNEMVNETNESEESDGSITDSMGPYREMYGNDFDDSDEDQDV
jgi:predicted lactoylglutathione lyase